MDRLKALLCFCVLDFIDCSATPTWKLLRESKQQTPWPRCSTAGTDSNRPQLAISALPTMNHSVHVNWNYQS